MGDQRDRRDTSHAHRRYPNRPSLVSTRRETEVAASPSALCPLPFALCPLSGPCGPFSGHEAKWPVQATRRVGPSRYSSASGSQFRRAREEANMKTIASTMAAAAILWGVSAAAPQAQAHKHVIQTLQE